MKKILTIAAVGCVLLVGCSKEEPAPLPALKPVELPKNTAGLYSGRLPCDECKMRMIRMELAEDSSATLVQTVVTDTMKTDTGKRPLTTMYPLMVWRCRSMPIIVW